MADNRPDCFATLDQVFPMEGDGLRHIPAHCLACDHKTPCLKTALQGRTGWLLAGERLDRNYRSGEITFLQRWSRKKTLHRIKTTNTEPKPDLGSGRRIPWRTVDRPIDKEDGK